MMPTQAQAQAQAQDAQVEVDFLGLEMDKKASEAAAPQPHPRLDRRRSFRDICKMDPEIVKSVIASAGKTTKTTTLPSDVTCPSPSPSALLPLPLPAFLRAAGGNPQETTPVTIFYNGTVSVFHLPNQKAQEIIKLAVELQSISYNNDGDLIHHSSLHAQPQNILPELDEGDMPIKRSQSLQRFFEKRKERLIPVFPYSHSVHQVTQPDSGEKISSQA